MASIDVLLARDVPALGYVGDVVKVKPGFARNYLFPQKMAVPVSKERVGYFEHQKRLIEANRTELIKASKRIKKDLENITVNITAKSGEQGKLFGSVGPRDIEKALKEIGYEIHHRDIKPETPLKTVGLHQVPVRLEADVKASLNVVVIAEEEETAKEEVKADEEPLEEIDETVETETAAVTENDSAKEDKPEEN